MLVSWLDMRSKVSHFGALVMAWLWSEYSFDSTFRHGVQKWVHGLPLFLKTLLGASISFYMWYRNPKRKETQ